MPATSLYDNKASVALTVKATSYNRSNRIFYEVEKRSLHFGGNLYVQKFPKVSFANKQAAMPACS